MASTSAAGEQPEQVLEEEIEEETVWDEMDEMQVEHFVVSCFCCIYNLITVVMFKQRWNNVNSNRMKLNVH